MVVEEADLRRGNSGVLELHRRSLLASKDDDVFALDAHGAGSYFCKLGGLELLEMAGEYLVSQLPEHIPPGKRVHQD